MFISLHLYPLVRDIYYSKWVLNGRSVTSEIIIMNNYRICLHIKQQITKENERRDIVYLYIWDNLCDSKVLLDKNYFSS